MATGLAQVIVIPSSLTPISVAGVGDELIRTVEKEIPEAAITLRGNEIQVTGAAEAIDLTKNLFGELFVVLRSGQALTPDVITRSVALLRGTTGEIPSDVLTADILTTRGRSIRPKSSNQKKYVDAIEKHTIIFGIGPAGTGAGHSKFRCALKLLPLSMSLRYYL